MLSNLLGNVFGKKAPVQWGIHNCLNGSFQNIHTLPFDITIDQGNDGGDDMCCLMEAQDNGKVEFSITAKSIPTRINHLSSGKLTLQPEKDYAIIIGPCLLLLHGTRKDISEWTDQIDISKWFVRKAGTDKKEGPWGMSELQDHIPDDLGKPEELETFPEGSTAGFPLLEVIKISEDSFDAPSPHAEEKTKPILTTAPVHIQIGAPASTTPPPSNVPATFSKPPPMPLLNIPKVEAPPTPVSAPPAIQKSQAPSIPMPNALPVPAATSSAPPIPRTMPPLPTAAARTTPPPALNLKKKQAEQEIIQINSETGELICPICWLRFDRGDIMHIAVHENLRGDPILGEDVPQRFFATHFNERGQALDAMGVACSDIACPHCRRKMPYGFLEIPHHIFSIVGAPSSGKSYYLSVLIHVLQQTLFHIFHVIFKDSDPSGNALLNEMKNQLFGSEDPERSALIKTQLEGIMYERLPRYGRTVALPKPFIFELTSGDDPRNKSSLVFYDNAGEHFEPGINTHESPGAQHVAASDGIYFLFDPTANTAFRQKLIHSKDPQLSLKQRLDQQDIILAETEIRIKNLKGLAPSDKIEAPIAVMVGKCDVWMELLKGKHLTYPVTERGLNLTQLDHNSQLVRELLVELCPSIVANVESISRNVRYFAISSLGHSPIALPDGRLAPIPSKLYPLFVDVPTLWMLSILKPDLISTCTDE